MKINSYTPKKLPLKSLDISRLLKILGKAHGVVGRFDALIKGQGRIFAPALRAQEVYASLHSQKVKATFEQILAGDKEGEVFKIINYQEALKKSSRAIRKNRLSLTMFRQIHAQVKKGSGGPKKDIGKFRDRQNWIGPEKCKMEDAYFYPPKTALVPKFMKNLERYAHCKEKDPLVQLAVFFAQFLIIHPFMDGNGRVVRACVPLFLFKKKMISDPIFYMSPYLKRHRLIYFDKLYQISAKGNWEGWIEFFLKGVVEQGEKSIRTVQRLKALYDKTCKKYGKKTTDALFLRPISKVRRRGVVKPYRSLWVFAPLVSLVKKG